MSSLPRRIHFSHHYDHQVVENATMNVPSVTITLFLLVIAFGGGFGSAVILKIGQLASPQEIERQIALVNHPFIVYRDETGSNLTNAWIIYTNSEYGFSLKIPTEADSVRFIDRPHTLKDYEIPFAVSLLLEYQDFKSFDAYKERLLGQGFQYLTEKDLNLGGRAVKQYDFLIENGPVEVYTLVPLKGSKHMVLSYLYSPKDKAKARREELETILSTLEFEE